MTLGKLKMSYHSFSYKASPKDWNYYRKQCKVAKPRRGDIERFT